MPYTASLMVSKTQRVFWAPEPAASHDINESCNRTLTSDPTLTFLRRLALEPLQYPSTEINSPKAVSWEPLCGVPKKMKPRACSQILRSAFCSLAFTTAFFQSVLVGKQSGGYRIHLLDNQTPETVADEDNRSTLLLRKEIGH